MDRDPDRELMLEVARHLSGIVKAIERRYPKTPTYHTTDTRG